MQKPRGPTAKLQGAANAAKNARQAFSKEGRRDLVRQAGATTLKAAKTVAKQAAKKAAKVVAKQAIQKGAAACVASVWCLLVVLAALLIVAGMMLIMSLVAFSGGADVELAVTDAGSGYGTTAGRESIADPDVLLDWWRLTSDDINHPVSLLERWVASGSDTAELRTAARSPQDCDGFADADGNVTAAAAAAAAAADCDQACDYLLGGLPQGDFWNESEGRLVEQGYVPEQDADTPEALREEIHQHNEYHGTDLCQSWWASAVAWNATLHETVDIGVRDVIAGPDGFPIRAKIVEAATAAGPVNPYDLHVLSVLALWKASGFGTPNDPDDGFARLYYSPAATDDYATRSAHNASLAHSQAPLPEPGATYPAPHSAISARRGIPYCGHIPEIGAAETAAKVMVPVPCVPPPTLEVCPGFIQYIPDNPRYGPNDSPVVLAENVVTSEKETMPPPADAPAGTPPTVDHHDPVPWGWANIPTSTPTPGAGIVVGYCAMVLDAEESFHASADPDPDPDADAGRLVWWAGWTDTENPAAAYHGCTPSGHSPQGRFVMTFCASEVVQRWVGPVDNGGHESTVNHLVAKLDSWWWEPPPPPPPDFGKLVAAVVSWRTDLVAGTPTAQRAFALAELDGWDPRYGLSGGQRAKLDALRASGEQGELYSCPRLFIAISDDEACDGPTVQQMRLWGWGPNLRDQTRVASLAAVTGRDPRVAAACPNYLDNPQSVDSSVVDDQARECVQARAAAYWGAGSGVSVGETLSGELLLDCGAPPSGGLSQDDADRVEVRTAVFSVAGGGARAVTLAPCLMPRAADMFELAHSHGVPLIPGSTYRTYQQQLDIRSGACGGLDPLSDACRPDPPVAVPGRSRHNFGMAIDFADAGTQSRLCGTPHTETEDPQDAKRSSVCHRWLTLYAPRFGFFPFLVEPWHWSTDGR